MTQSPRQISIPRGTHDILGPQAPLWEKLEASARRVLTYYGYSEIRTPIYEDVALFKRSLGDTSDVVNKQLLELKSSTEDEGLALRPEGTAAVVRSYIENNNDKKEPLSKLFYVGPMFRGERPQKGRLRQFHQIGVEAIGPQAASPLLDAEVLALAMHLLKECGVQTPKLLLNTLGSVEDKQHVSVFLRDAFNQRRDLLCEDCRQRFERNVFRVLDCKKPPCKAVVAEVLGNQGLPLSAESTAYFDKVKASLTDLNIPFTIAPHLVRGLDYYTHTVFEITSEGLGSQDAVGAGGRYSGLLHQLGADPKTEFSAIGFAVGVERILLASGQTEGIVKGLDAYMVVMDHVFSARAFNLIQQLRLAGISADMSYNGASMKSQLSRANKLSARFALILGEDEMKSEKIAVKDMTASTQEIIDQKDLVNYLTTRLK